ncbi:MAG TPA: hypothetical protein VJ180_05560 [Pyrinomonadaceae bacterium]|nr:hypothetical protein [Pyrinomonadaceae bacterium]
MRVEPAQINGLTCDSDSRSEIVVPIITNGYLHGVLDLDSPALARFDDEDGSGLNDLIEIFIESTSLSARDAAKSK